VPGLAGDVPGGGVVPANGGTVLGKVGPVMPVVTGGMVETFDSIDGIVEDIVQQKTNIVQQNKTKHKAVQQWQF